MQAVLDLTVDEAVRRRARTVAVKDAEVQLQIELFELANSD